MLYAIENTTTGEYMLPIENGAEEVIFGVADFAFIWDDDKDAQGNIYSLQRFDNFGEDLQVVDLASVLVEADNCLPLFFTTLYTEEEADAVLEPVFDELEIYAGSSLRLQYKLETLARQVKMELLNAEWLPDGEMTSQVLTYYKITVKTCGETRIYDRINNAHVVAVIKQALDI